MSVAALQPDQFVLENIVSLRDEVDRAFQSFEGTINFAARSDSPVIENASEPGFSEVELFVRGGKVRQDVRNRERGRLTRVGTLGRGHERGDL